MYCSDTTLFWNGDDTLLECSDLGLKPGEPHKICRGNDRECVENEPYQDCVRGPNHCFNSDAVQQYDSELHALDDMKVARLAIGVGDESNVSSGSALWMIDDKYVLKYKLYLLYNFVFMKLSLIAANLFTFITFTVAHFFFLYYTYVFAHTNIIKFIIQSR